MTPRRFAVLLVAGLVAIGGALWLASQRSLPRDPRVGEHALPGLDADLDALHEVRLARGDTLTTLRKGASGWEVVERGLPVDAGRLRKLLLDLAALEVVEVKTSDPAKYVELGVEDPSDPRATGTSITLETPETTREIVAGRQGGLKSGYVRVVGEAASLLASPQIAADPSPAHWIDRTWLDVPADQVALISAIPPKGPKWVASRPEAAAALMLRDLPKGSKQRAPDTLTNAAGFLTALACDDIAKVPDTMPDTMPDAGAPTGEAAHVLVRTFDGREIAISGRVDGARHWIRTEVTPAEARFAGRECEVPRYKYDALFRPLSDFVIGS